MNKLSKIITGLGILLSLGKAKAQDIRPDLFYDSRKLTNLRTYVFNRYPKNIESVGFLDLNLEKDRTYNWYGENAFFKPMFKGLGPAVENITVSDAKDYSKLGLTYSGEPFGIYTLLEVYPLSTEKDGRSVGLYASKEFIKVSLELLIDRTFPGMDLVELQGSVKLKDGFYWTAKLQYNDYREKKKGVMIGVSLKF